MYAITKKRNKEKFNCVYTIQRENKKYKVKSNRFSVCVQKIFLPKSNFKLRRMKSKVERVAVC